MATGGDPEWIQAVVDGDPDVELEPRLRTTLEFLRRLTLEPWELTPDDVQPMRDAGVSDAAIEEAIAVCATFSIIDRLADAFEFPLSDERQLWQNGQLLGKMGYGGAAIPGGG